MAEGRMVAGHLVPYTPLEKLQARFGEWDAKVKSWVAKQSAPVEVVLVSLGGALQGGAIGGLMGSLTSDMASSIPTPPPAAGASPEAMNTLKQMQAVTGGPWAQAKNFAVLAGVNAGITCAVKRARGGVEDIQTSMVAAFGSGIALTLVSGAGGNNLAGNAITSGVVFALFQGALFKVGESFGGNKDPAKDIAYLRTKAMLTTLGLQKYEKNFKKGLLDDATLPLLNESALQEVKIPPGPRLLILDHVKRLDYSDDVGEEPL